jgi:hypothetical protein
MLVCSCCIVQEGLTGGRPTRHAVQVTVPLTLTLTVPDQITADLLHTSTAEPPFPSPHNSSALATRVDAAALALSDLARSGAFHDIPMKSLAVNLQLSFLPYPVVADANVSIIITDASENFTAVRSPQVDTLQATLLAFAEAAAFELDVLLRAMPELPESFDVRSSVINFGVCSSLKGTQKAKNSNSERAI